MSMNATDIKTKQLLWKQNYFDLNYISNILLIETIILQEKQQNIFNINENEEIIYLIALNLFYK